MLVSLIIPCYNVSEKKLNRMMQSILTQIYQKLQVILVDDGSADDTLTRLFNWKKYFDTKGIDCEIFRKPNGGIASAINLGLKYFTGKYVCFPDADDALEAEYVSSMVTYLEANPACNIVRCNFKVITKTANHLAKIKLVDQDFNKYGFFKTALTNQIYTNVWPMLVRSDFLKQRIPNLHLYEGGILASQELQLLLPLTYRTEVAHIKKPLYNYYIYADSHARRSMGDSEDTILTYNAKVKEVLLATLNTMPLTNAERDIYRDIGELCVARLNMAIEYMSTNVRYSCALLLAYLLNKYMKSTANIEALMIPERFFFHSQRLHNYFLEQNSY